MTMLQGWRQWWRRQKEAYRWRQRLLKEAENNLKTLGQDTQSLTMEEIHDTVLGLGAAQLATMAATKKIYQEALKKGCYRGDPRLN